MDSKKINQLATNVAPSVYDLTVVGDPTTGQLKKITLNQIASLFGSVGGVSSVGMTVPTGLTVTGSPITTSGTLAVTLSAGYSIPTTAKQSEWDLGYSERLKWDGGASGLSAPTARTSLGLVIGTDVLAYRTFGSAANNNTGDFATAAQGTNADTAYTNRITGASLPLSISSNVISIAQATTTVSGFLSTTDWNTFNGKQAALNGTGFVKATGTTISYDNSIYLTTSAASSTYLPLSGGTLTGTLNGTIATFSGNVGIGGSITTISGFTSLTIDNSSNGSFLDLNNSGTNNLRFLTLSSVDQRILATGNLTFYTASNQRMQIASSGNVGIGTSTFPASSNRLLFLNAPSGAAAQMLLGEAETSYAYLYGYGGDAGLFTTAAIPLIFGTNNTEKVRITSNGNILVNTTSDNGQGKLQVNGAITATNISYTGEFVNTTSTTLNTTYYKIIASGIPSGQTYTLPSPTSNNLQYVIVNKTAFSQTISAGSGFTIYDMSGTNSASITLASKARCYIIADGSSFYQIF